MVRSTAKFSAGTPKAARSSITALAEDVDFLKLAEKYELTGSSIQSVAVSAAFHAVKDEKYVCMKHIKKALIAEFEKNGKAFLDEDFDTY